MPTKLVLLFLVIALAQAQPEQLYYQILSQGEQVYIQLEDHFKFAKSASINYEKSSPDFNSTFETKNSSSENYRQVFSKAMEIETPNKIRLSDSLYYSSKTIYNQPVKIFLLANNYIMMLIYKQHCTDACEENQVIGLNLTENLPIDLKYKNILCTSLDVMVTDSKNYAYVSCRAEENIKFYTFFLIEIDLTTNLQGFIAGMEILQYYIFLHKTSTCFDYSLKYFELIKLDKATLENRILLYCRNATSSGSPPTYFFHLINEGIFQISSESLSQCLINATYISPIQNGFITVINKQVYEYYSNQTKGQSQCLKTELKNINYIFAASRTYNNIQITYFFLRNNSIIIKSSYRTNYQKFAVNCSGFSFTSYALTEQFMALSLSNINGDTRILVYEMEELYPRLVDDTVVERGQKYGNFVLMSTSNYLEKGFYIFVYNTSSNQLSLKEYNGYILTITPKSLQSSFIRPLTRTKKVSRLQSLSSPKSKLGSSPFPENSTINKLCIQSSDDETGTEQSMIIYIVVRKFNDTNIAFYTPTPLVIDSHYVNFNLSTLTVGPLQRFYINENLYDKNIRLQFVNYFNTISISDILSGSSAPASEKVKQITLNLQLKVLNPVFTLYYTTFIQNCILKYIRQKFEFTMECNSDDIINFKSKIQSNFTKILVLTKDRWLQYNNESLEFCIITGEFAQCELLPLDEAEFYPINVTRIKIVRFDFKLNGDSEIEMFILSEKKLYYGTFKKDTNIRTFWYEDIFSISANEVLELEYMQLVNIHFDMNYNHYLLLHLSIEDGSIVKHMAFLYDHPASSNSNKFLGHLIRKFEDEQIESIMSIDSILIILYRQENGHTTIREYQITQFYSVYETRMYPLYGRKIIQNGAHVSDGQFLFIEAELQRKEEGKSEYLVFCPSLGTTNILTHVIPKQSMITFIQHIGEWKNKYRHSIGVHGQNIFALSIPNLAIKFDYNAEQNNANMNHGVVVTSDGKQKVRNNKITGMMDLKLVDYNNVMHGIIYQYQFDISAEVIEYSESDIVLDVNDQQPIQVYALKPNKIAGPVMEVSLATECPFLQKNIKFEDIFTKTTCLMNIDSKMYGSLLDLMTVSLSIEQEVEIIITTSYLMCVEDRKIMSLEELPLANSCNIVSFQNGRGLFVCDEGQGSVINSFTFYNPHCAGLYLKRNIQKPSWLIYQYFKMKYADPFVVFEVPIRVEYNKIYFLTKYQQISGQFSDKFSSITSNQYDNFETQDFQIFDKYAYMLEEGLGIYDLALQTNLTNPNIEPILWIAEEDIQKALNTSASFVYIKPKEVTNLNGLKYGQFFCSEYKKVIHMQIGTTTHAYDIKICLNENDIKFQIIPLIVYNQYKDCQNNILSKSKNYSGLTMKLCILEMDEHKIFSNFMPLVARNSQYYMQFYSIDPEKTVLQTLYPFRMEKVSTNDTFQIKEYRGELIVKSLFNFICYYKLETEVKWSIYLNPNWKLTQNQNKSCNATLVLKNENFIKKFNITVKNTNQVEDRSFMPWIFRAFFIVLTLVSIIKFRMHIALKKRKLNTLRYNLISNEFQFQVRINTKKEVEWDMGQCEKNSETHLH